MVEEEPLLDQELLQEAEKIPELDQNHIEDAINKKILHYSSDVCAVS